MKLADLWCSDSFKDLASEGYNPVLLHEVVKPFLENLHQEYIIYREKNVSLAKLSDVDITKKRFGARAEVECMISQITPRYPKEWDFGCTWEWFRLSGSWLAASPYVGFQVMVDADLVAKVQWCMNKGDLEQAMKLIVERESEGNNMQEKMRPVV